MHLSLISGVFFSYFVSDGEFRALIPNNEIAVLKDYTSYQAHTKILEKIDNETVVLTLSGWH